MPNEIKKPGDAKKDLIWVILLLVGLFLLWLATGGPSKESSKTGPFLKSPCKGIQEEISKDGQIKEGETLAKQQLQKESIYKSKINLTVDRNAKKSDPQEEYIIIQASSGNTDPINTSNWVLEKRDGSRVSLGGATLLPKLGEINSQEEILLSPGDKAIVTTGESPIGTGFKLNKCMGYFEQMQDFVPKLPLDCPLPIDDEILPTSLDDNCIDYIDREFERCTVYFSYPSNLSNACKEYINERINYRGCVQWHKNDPNFYKPEWRIYLNKQIELWDNDRETIILYDENNKIIDWQSY